MSQAPIKLIPRNVAALRADNNLPTALGRCLAIRSRLARIWCGNCFPGLECDLRNLERRFFLLEVDIQDTEIDVISVTWRAFRSRPQRRDFRRHCHYLPQISSGLSQGRSGPSARCAGPSAARVQTLVVADLRLQARSESLAAGCLDGHSSSDGRNRGRITPPSGNTTRSLVRNGRAIWMTMERWPNVSAG